jgi:hypothetical protein
VSKARTDYGISRRGTLVVPIAQSVAEIVAAVPEAVTLGGPRWLDPRAFTTATKSTLSRNDRLGVAVLVDGTLAVKLETRGRGLEIRVLKDADLIRPDDPLAPHVSDLPTTE